MRVTSGHGEFNWSQIEVTFKIQCECSHQKKSDFYYKSKLGIKTCSVNIAFCCQWFKMIHKASVLKLSSHWSFGPNGSRRVKSVGVLMCYFNTFRGQEVEQPGFRRENNRFTEITSKRIQYGFQNRLNKRENNNFQVLIFLTQFVFFAGIHLRPSN